MAVRQPRWVMAIVVFSLMVLAASLEAREDTSEAEKVAKTYMTALSTGDVETAAKLTHTKTLDDLKKRYIKDLDRAKTEGHERDFLRSTGVEASAGELRAMNPYELYVTLMEGSRKMSGAQSRSGQKAEVTVEGSKKLGASEISVSLKVVVSTEEGPKTQKGALLLVKDGSVWRVKADQKPRKK